MDLVTAERRRIDRGQTAEIEHVGRTHHAIERHLLERRAPIDEMRRRIDVRPGMGPEREMREIGRVAARDGPHLRRLERRIAGIDVHVGAIDDRDVPHAPIVVTRGERELVRDPSRILAEVGDIDRVTQRLADREHAVALEQDELRLRAGKDRVAHQIRRASASPTAPPARPASARAAPRP